MDKKTIINNVNFKLRERIFREAEEDSEESDEEEYEQQEAPEQENPAGPDVPEDGMEGDPNMDQQGVDVYGNPLPPPLEKTDIGKLYQLKKTYNKLISLRNIVSRIDNIKFNTIKLQLNDAVEIMGIVVDNYEKFKDDINSLLRNYNEYIVSVVKIISKKYK